MVLIEDLKNLKKCINNKLRDYRRRDKIKKEIFQIENEELQTIKIKDAIKLINELDDDICRGCKCKMLFNNYKPYCVYQFSFDRIDNNKIHSIDNLQIVCWNCNSSGYNSIKNYCTHRCH